MNHVVYADLSTTRSDVEFSRRRGSAILRLLQSAKMEDVSGFGNDYNTTFPGNESFQQYDDSHVTGQQNAADQFSSIMLRRVVWYVIAVALGIPGNVLSAIVWLRRHISRNSSAVYLVALAINDLVYLLCYCLYKLIEDLHPSPYDVLRNLIWYYSADYILQIAVIFEPLLVLSFSVERLIIIVRPLRVCRMCLRNYYV